MRFSLLIFLTGCSTLMMGWNACTSCMGCPATNPQGSAPTATLNPAPRPPDLKPAPSKDFLGLTLGGTQDAEITAWLATHNLNCPASPSPRRTTQRYECKTDLPVALLPGRIIQGKLTSLLLVRGDSTPLSHASAGRQYSLPEDAAKDYESTVATISASLGEPYKKTVIDPEKLKSPLLHYSTTWKFTDLDVSVTLLKAGGNFYSMEERWDVPGVEMEQQARPSKNPHNPHGTSTGGKDPFGFDQQ
jgi:hypothetical protein